MATPFEFLRMASSTCGSAKAFWYPSFTMAYSRSSTLFDTSVRSTSARSTGRAIGWSAGAAVLVIPATKAVLKKRRRIDGLRSEICGAARLTRPGWRAPSALGLSQVRGDLVEIGDDSRVARD